MDGQPVWLASLSRQSVITGDKVLIPRWPKEWLRDGIRTLREVLGEAGDPSRERHFRMNLTLCIHRALKEDEIARFPCGWDEGPHEGIAGAPVEVLWENTPGSLSTKPCANPTRMPLPRTNDPVFGWIPFDCGTCQSCLARIAA